MCVVSTEYDDYDKEEARIREEQDLTRLEELVETFNELSEQFSNALDLYEADLVECDMLLKAVEVKFILKDFNDNLPLV